MIFYVLISYLISQLKKTSDFFFFLSEICNEQDWAREQHC